MVLTWYPNIRKKWQENLNLNCDMFCVIFLLREGSWQKKSLLSFGNLFLGAVSVIYLLTWDELGNLTGQRTWATLCCDNEGNDGAWWSCIFARYLRSSSMHWKQNMVVQDGLKVYECQPEFEEFCNTIEFW